MTSLPPHPDTVRFGTMVARHRRLRGLSQRQLAKTAGVSFSTVSRMESGGVGFGFDPAARVAQALGYGDTGRVMAGLFAAQTRAWQPHHGLPAYAVVVVRPVGEWAVVEDKQEVPDAG